MGLGRGRWKRLKLKFAQDEVEVQNSMNTLDRRQRWGRRGTEFEPVQGKARLHSLPFGFCALPPLSSSVASWLLCRAVASQRCECPLAAP